MLQLYFLFLSWISVSTQDAFVGFIVEQGAKLVSHSLRLNRRAVQDAVIKVKIQVHS